MVINLKNNKNIFNVVIVGSGNIGSRHLQGLLLIDIPINIYVVDNDSIALKKSKTIFKNTKTNKNIKSIYYFDNINKLNLQIDLAIVATNSNIRRKIIEKLVSSNIIKFFLIEKIAFQSEKDFIEIINLLKKNKIKTWVNLAKRTFPFFKKLKKKIKNRNKIIMNASSGNFDIGCNTIHYLDLLYYFTKSKIKDIDMSLIDKKIYKSKRKGYIDFSGTIKINSYNGDQLNITNYYNSSKDHILEISSNKFYYMFLPFHNKIYFTNKKNKLTERFFYQPIQSELTNLITKDILLKGRCVLPSLEESFLTHKPMLNSFIKHVNLINKTKVTKCKIT